MRKIENSRRLAFAVAATRCRCYCVALIIGSNVASTSLQQSPHGCPVSSQTRQSCDWRALDSSLHLLTALLYLVHQATATLIVNALKRAETWGWCLRICKVFVSVPPACPLIKRWATLFICRHQVYWRQSWSARCGFSVCILYVVWQNVNASFWACVWCRRCVWFGVTSTLITLPYIRHHANDIHRQPMLLLVCDFCIAAHHTKKHFWFGRYKYCTCCIHYSATNTA